MYKAIANRKTTFACLVIFIFTLLTFPAWSSARKEVVHLTKEDFLAQAFEDGTPELKALWLKGDLKTAVSKTLGHDYPALRVRYWILNNRSAWILEEIGKEKPITAGFVIQENRLEIVKVLVFRESRGDEVKYPSFTEQFTGATLNNKQQLDRRIDGISGATLSVNALRKLAAVALQLSDHVMKQQASK